ncbi:uncharacterized protein LOC105207058 [Solenopsis invicta]|uniref:uncharacterized protein LOC105207058 n=1 Tax=Solenopsis invicta TaxID=13686 RepID=UPI00193D32C2|nr:uncharacterized protein LOC105207058 [Solenopsis invicta]XP_039309079.1 uncharacterized protein LOC105207058 [Solenopsis invicta]XP_039309081.1 uncharacterized protein LOC105207058 [Solenopsis invicta]XP_039309084.1 uncharacterized protein LOC105207058 [Solenopsis invicta]XP_039309086.1 uncharacterized protein LOC105207058 [Solenopsis invicta]XP_039309089.1 uncharacterized protein LOC105207058 [Solenopsis invicta]XP_039309093.1 uncharacterized protein LOC105207058 [Solenopsis invicta]XP_0
MAELALLIKQRGRVKAKLTNFSNFIQRIDELPENKEELPLRIEKAEGLLTEFEIIQNKIEDADAAETQLIDRQEFENRYYQLITAARKLQIRERAPPLQTYQDVQINAQRNVDNVGNEQFVFRPAVKLPTIELPKFDGNYEQWIPFRDLFQSLIASNASIPAVQKLHYLRSALTGEAAKVITTLKITNDNYEVAWTSLKQRFENKRLITHHLIQTLLDMPPIPRESHADLRQLADNISQITQNLAKLGQPIEHFAIWVIHIMLPKIDKNSRREWEFTRSDTDEFPTLDNFINFLINRSACLEAVFRASRGTQPLSDSRNNNKTAQSQGKNISRSYVAASSTACSICSNDHKINECSSFLSMAVADRNTEIRKKRLCVKCLKRYHGKGCKVSNCKLCNGYHNTLLHKSNVSTAEKDQETKPQDASQTKLAEGNTVKKQGTTALAADSPVLINHLVMKEPSQVLLSTAIVLIHDSQGNLHKCRALLDNGSHSNFITRKLNNKLKLRYKTTNKNIKGMSNMPISATHQTNAVIQSRTSKYQAKIPLVIVDSITDLLPIFKINKDYLNIPQS